MSDVPATVIVKQTEPARYDKDNPESTASTGVINDWAASLFLSECDYHGAPRNFGGDAELGFVVLEDLGDTRGLDEVLQHESAETATAALVAMARAVGEMHAATVGKAARFAEIRHRLGYRPAELRYSLDAQLKESVGRALDFVATVGVSLGEGTMAELNRIVEIVLDPGPFQAYTHSDPCPDNARLAADGTVRLIDFEYGSFGHALLDAAYPTALFPTCWAASGIPESVQGQFLGAYRERVAQTCEAARDDAVFGAAFAHACAFWTMNTWIFVRDKSIWEFDIEHGLATVRQRIINRNANMAAHSRRTGHFPAFGALCERLNAELGQMWPDVLPMPVFAAFRPA